MEQHVTFRRVAGMLVGIVIISLGAVSYTHLDVYKRQQHFLAAVAKAGSLDSNHIQGAAQTVDDEVGQSGRKLLIIAEDVEGDALSNLIIRGTISWNTLIFLSVIRDVYKRQCLCWILPCRCPSRTKRRPCTKT